MTLASSIRLARGALLTMHNAKTEKGEALGYLTGILYLAPHELSGYNVCQFSNAACRADCLFSAGRGALPSVIAARMLRTHKFFNGREAFMYQLEAEIAALVANARANGLKPAVRLNGTSDIPWYRVPYGDRAHIMEAFPDVQFYDYTKRPHNPDHAPRIPRNYHLSFSLTGENGLAARNMVSLGHNVIAVTRDASGLIMAHASADAHDLRFLDPPAHVMTLTPKGRARRAPVDSGLVMSAPAINAALGAL